MHGAEATSSETSGSVAAAAATAAAAAAAAPAAASAADPLAVGEAIDELLAANDDHESSKKRKYPEPGFRSRKVRASRREKQLHHRVQNEGSSIHEGPLRGRQLGGEPRGGTSSRCSKKSASSSG